MLGGEHPNDASTVAPTGLPASDPMERLNRLLDDSEALLAECQDSQSLTADDIDALDQIDDIFASMIDKLDAILNDPPERLPIEIALRDITKARLSGVDLPPVMADAVTETSAALGPSFVSLIIDMLVDDTLNADDLVAVAGLHVDPESEGFGLLTERLTAIVGQLQLRAITVDPVVALAALMAVALAELDAGGTRFLTISAAEFAEESPPPRLRDIDSLVAAARPGPQTGVMPVAA